MVVASIALLVALTGTGIAAVTLIVPKNSVGTAQLKNNAVTSAKVAKNAINSNRVQNKSLLAADFAPGQIPAGPQGPSGPPGPAGVAPPGYVASVSSQNSATASTTSSTSYVELPGSLETVVVPTGQTARIVTMFSGESRCIGGLAFDTCGVRVTVDGNELAPAAGTDFAFDTSNPTDGWESHAIVRISETLSAGNHPVRVEYRTSSGATTFRLDDWLLAIMLQRQS
jgi:hypothetical protein